MTGESAVTLHHQGDRHTLRFERRFPHALDRVWEAISNVEEMDRWFPARVVGTRRAGTKLHFHFPPQPGQTPSDAPDRSAATTWGELLVWDPPRVLEFTWGDEVLRFVLTRSEGRTQLVFTHTFHDLTKAARDASGWTVCLDALDALLDGRAKTPFTPERFETLFAEYASRFGPEASSTRAPG